ncbi:hypothetical protein ACKLJT_24380, partial [Klebsiella pneumoniae]
KRAYFLKTQPTTGETYPKSDLFNKADYNECRPHSSRKYQTPAEFTADWRNGKYEEKPTDITN